MATVVSPDLTPTPSSSQLSQTASIDTTTTLHVRTAYHRAQPSRAINEEPKKKKKKAQKRVLEEFDQFRGDEGAPDMIIVYCFDYLQNTTVVLALPP